MQTELKWNKDDYIFLETEAQAPQSNLKGPKFLKAGKID
jgi:hypothetical protein